MFPVVPAGIPFPVGPVRPIGLCVTQSPSDFEPVGPDGPYVGPVGPCGTQSPSDFEIVGPDGPYVGPVGPSDSELAKGPVGPGGTLSSPDSAGILFPAMPAGILLPVGPVGPIGSYGTLCLSDSDSAILVDPGGVFPGGVSGGVSDSAGPAILVDPGGVFPSSDLTDMRGSDTPAESAILMGPVGPPMWLGVLPPADSESADPVIPTRRQSSSIVVFVGPLHPGGMLLPGEDGPGLCPIVWTDDLLSVAAVPLTAVRDPVIAQSPVEGLVRDCDDVGEEAITVPGGWSGPEVAKIPAVVAMVGLDALPMRNDAPLDCVDECTAWCTDQCGTIDGMTVCYGGDLCDSDESDWDDPYDIASAEYVDQYNFDVPEGMDLMVFERCRGPYGSEMLEDEGTGLAHVCQTTLSDPQGEFDIVDIDPLADVFEEKLSVTAAAVSPNVRSGSGSYDYGTILVEEGDISNSDDRSIEDRERNSWVDWSNSAFRNGISTFPSDADDPQPLVVFNDKLLSNDILADTSVSIHEEVPVLTLKIFTEEGVPLVPPVIDQGVRRIEDELISQDKRMEEILVLPWPICDPPIHNGTSDNGLSPGDTEWFCLLYSADAGSVAHGTMARGLGGQGLDHWRGVVWDPGIVGQQCLHVCYDCLCLMALFRAVMLLVHDWAEWSVWTGPESWYCRTITWELGYLRGRHPCYQMARQIKGSVVVMMTDRNDNNSLQRCACVCGTSLGVLSVGRIPIIRVIVRIGSGGGPVGCSDWLRVRGADVISPGGVRIGYIRKALCGRSSTDAAPVTGSLLR